MLIITLCTIRIFYELIHSRRNEPDQPNNQSLRITAPPAVDAMYTPIIADASTIGSEILTSQIPRLIAILPPIYSSDIIPGHTRLLQSDMEGTNIPIIPGRDEDDVNSEDTEDEFRTQINNGPVNEYLQRAEQNTGFHPLRQYTNEPIRLDDITLELEQQVTRGPTMWILILEGKAKFGVLSYSDANVKIVSGWVRRKMLEKNIRLTHINMFYSKITNLIFIPTRDELDSIKVMRNLQNKADYNMYHYDQMTWRQWLALSFREKLLRFIGASRPLRTIGS